MEEEKNAYYVVKKGDVVGFYKTLNECRAQAADTTFGPDATVYKLCNLSREAEQYLASRGLQNATYSINAADVTKDLFGQLCTCPYEQPSSSRQKMAEEHSGAKKEKQMFETTEYGYVGANWTSKNSPELHYIGPNQISTNSPEDHYIGHNWISTNSPEHHSIGTNWISKNSPERQYGNVGAYCSTNTPQHQYNLDNSYKTSAASSRCATYFLEFDGASKGNPGPAGAGAVLRSEDGSVVCRLQEGVGIATNNVAEYRAVILGLKHALKNGFKHIRVQGDSKLVCMQIQGLWKIKNPNMAALCKVAKELKDKFLSFEINHVLRELNSDADVQANRGIYLRDGQVVEDCQHK